MRRWLAIAAVMLPAIGLAQVARPPSGGVIHRDFQTPSGVQQQFLGSWILTWDDPVDPSCPCHAVLTIETKQDGALKGYWPLKGGTAVLDGEVSFSNSVWVGRFAQADDLDFPLKGHFRLEARDMGGGLTGSYHRDGASIPFRWSATKR
jgi:hypothetical protein